MFSRRNTAKTLSAGLFAALFALTSLATSAEAAGGRTLVHNVPLDMGKNATLRVEYQPKSRRVLLSLHGPRKNSPQIRGLFRKGIALNVDGSEIGLVQPRQLTGLKTGAKAPTEIHLGVIPSTTPINHRGPNIVVKLLGRSIASFEPKAGALEATPMALPTAFDLRNLAQNPNAYASKWNSSPYLTPELAKVTPVVDMHTHFAGALRGESLVRVAADKKATYPVALLDELGIKYAKSKVRKPNGYAVISVAALSEGSRQKLARTLDIDPMQIVTFADMETFYKYRGPLTKNRNLFAGYLWELAKDYKDAGVKYALPSISDIVKADWLAVAHAEIPKIEKQLGVKMRFVVGLWRHSPTAFNHQLLDQMKALNDPLIVGADWMGHETNRTKDFASEIAKAKAYGFPFRRVHAGESPIFPRNVREAVEAGATNLGHGIYGTGGKVMQMIKDAEIITERCFTSNLALNNILAAAAVPVKRYARNGNRQSASTDGHGLYGTNAIQETVIAAAAGLTVNDLKKMRASDERFIKDLEAWVDKKKVAYEKRGPVAWEAPEGPDLWKVEEDRKQARRETLKAEVRKVATLVEGARPAEVTKNAARHYGARDLLPLRIAGATALDYAALKPAEKKQVRAYLEAALDRVDAEVAYLVLDGASGGVSELAAKMAKKKGFEVLFAISENTNAKKLAHLKSYPKARVAILGESDHEMAPHLAKLVKAEDMPSVFLGGGMVASDEIQTAANEQVNVLPVRATGQAAAGYAKRYDDLAVNSIDSLMRKLDEFGLLK